MLSQHEWVVAYPEDDAKGKETLKEQYVRGHYEVDLKHTREAIEKLYPEYLSSFSVAGRVFPTSNSHKYMAFRPPIRLPNECGEK